jgi:Na+/melibiose symporter-like transporter
VTNRPADHDLVFINLPFDGISLILLTLVLRLDSPRTPLLQGLKSFDWIGSVTIVGGTICFLCGLDAGTDPRHGWKSAFAIGLLCGGIALLIIFSVYEWHWAQSPLVPCRALANRFNIASILTAVFHGFVFVSFDFFLPLYFQVVLGASPLHSGLYLFALVLPLSAMSFATGQFIRRTGKYDLSAWIGAAVMTLGTGLFISFDASIVWWKIIVYQVIAGIGAGPLFLSPMLSLQDHLEKEYISTGTSAFTFMRSLATSMTVVVGGVVLQNVGLSSGSLTPHMATSDGGDGNEAAAATPQEYSKALSKMWIFYTAVCGLMLLSSMGIRKKANSQIGPRGEADPTPAASEEGAGIAVSEKAGAEP